MSTAVDAQLPKTALDRLRGAGCATAPLPTPCRDLMRSARLAGATWDEIGDVLGLTGEQARSRFAESIPQTQHVAVGAAANLSDEDVMKLAVAETRAVRQQHSKP